jgi:hypothetical protein
VSVTCGDLSLAHIFPSGADVGGARRWKHVTDLDSQTPPTMHTLSANVQNTISHACLLEPGGKRITHSPHALKYRRKSWCVCPRTHIIFFPLKSHLNGLFMLLSSYSFFHEFFLKHLRIRYPMVHQFLNYDIHNDFRFRNIYA